jgi:hypothetical protein
MRFGNDTGWTSGEILKIYKSLKSGSKEYSDIAKICDNSGCRGGFRVNALTNEMDECDKCKGFGIIKK